MEGELVYPLPGWSHRTGVCAGHQRPHGGWRAGTQAKGARGV